MIYEVPITYTFRGVIEIEADNARVARKIAMEDCGANLGAFQTSNGSAVLDWDIDTTPEKHVGIIIGGSYE